MVLTEHIKENPYFFALTIVALLSLVTLTSLYPEGGISGQQVSDRAFYEASLGGQAKDYCEDPNMLLIDVTMRNKFMGLECEPTSHGGKYCCARIPEQ